MHKTPWVAEKELLANIPPVPGNIMQTTVVGQWRNDNVQTTISVGQFIQHIAGHLGSVSVVCFRGAAVHCTLGCSQEAPHVHAYPAGSRLRWGHGRKSSNGGPFSVEQRSTLSATKI